VARHLPINPDSAGGRVHDGHFYVTDDRGLTIYDISDPEQPFPTGFWPAPQNPWIPEEDPDTNGEILLISGYSDLLPYGNQPWSYLQIIDVSDKSQPVLRSMLPGAKQHTWSCILDCTWAYGNGGLIADLRDPDNPRLSDVRWQQQVTAQGYAFRSSTHDVTEVAPGLVLTSSNPLFCSTSPIRRIPRSCPPPRCRTTGSSTGTCGRAGPPTRSCSSGVRPSVTATASSPVRS
jgi:hypothetical protein